jgi:hypothetical protein
MEMQRRCVEKSGTSRTSVITALYERHLGHAPDAQGLQFHLESGAGIAEIEARICGCPEYLALQAAIATTRALLRHCGGTRNLLLFGAYGNGNLGDREMARVLAGWIEANCLGTCFAHSDLALVDYPFAPGRVLNGESQPLNPRILSLFDGLVIGGGGLLDFPHMPLWQPAWPYSVPVPYVLLGCGVGQPLDGRLANLVRRAASASARDEDGVAELRRHHDTAMHCADPILALYTPPTADATVQEGARCLILRGPLCPWHQQVLASQRPGDQVVLFEAGIDWQLFYLFPNAVVVRTLDEAAAHVARSTLVISERYHGAVLGLLAGRPTLGVWRGDQNSGKLVSLFASLGIAQFCRQLPVIPDTLDGFPLPAVAARLAAMRARFPAQARTVIDALPAPAPGGSD